MIDTPWIARLEQHVFDRKGTLQFTYDYHSSSWVGVRQYKDKTFVSTVTDEGEGQGTIEQAARELIRKLEI